MTLFHHAMPVIRAIRRAASVLSLGFFGGWALGFLFLFFGFAIGRSGNTGVEETFTLFEIGAIVELAGIYGGLLGILLLPIGYYAFLRNLHFGPPFNTPPSQPRSEASPAPFIRPHFQHYWVLLHSSSVAPLRPIMFRRASLRQLLPLTGKISPP